MARVTSADMGFNGFLLRFLFAQITVFATYNPSGFSYHHWALLPFFSGNPQLDPLKAVAGIILVIAWAVFLIATIRSLRWLGTVLVGGFFATLIWLAVDWQLLPTDNLTLWIYLSEAVIGAIMGIGVSWSHIHRRITGQVDMDPVDR